MKKLLRVFAIRSAILFVAWMMVYHWVIKPDGRVNNWLTTQVVAGTKLGLEVLGYESTHGLISDGDPNSSRYVYIDGQPVVLVADACNGLELMALFVGFLIAFPGPINNRLVFIPVGTFLVYCINVLREIILALNYKFFQETFDFNHKYTYVLVVYSAIFLMWRFWLNRYSGIGKRVENES